MKRAFTHKLKPALPVPHDNDALGEPSERKLSGGVTGPLKANSPEVNRRARTSAAMIGLAISMGASSLLMPRGGDEAMAAEPVTTEPTVTNVPTLSDNATATSTPVLESEVPSIVSKSLAVEPEVSSLSSTPTGEQEASSLVSPAVEPEVNSSGSQPAPRVLEHQVQPGQTLWQLSKTYQVDAAAINASNDLKPSSVLPSGQVIKIPSVNGIVHQVKSGDTVETLSQSYGVAPNQLQPSSAPEQADVPLPVGESVTIAGDVNDLLKARQESSLNRLKEQQNRLQSSLAELKSEESTHVSEQAKTQLIKPVAEPAQTLLPQLPQTEAAATEERQEVLFAPPVASVSNRVINPAPLAKTPKAEKSAASTSLPVVLNEPKLSAVPNLVTNPTTLGVPKVIPTTPIVVEPQAQEDVYAVRPGDTIDAIARSYGISKAELIRANQLNNPNLIRVNQQLKIPSNQTVALLPGLSPVPGQAQQQFIASKTVVASLSVPTLPTSGTPAVKTEPLNRVTPITVAENPIPSTAPLVANQPNQSAGVKQNSDYNPYVEKLRVEIVKLREQYRVQQSGGTAETASTTSVNIPVPAAAVSVPVPRALNTTSTPSNYINPEFSPNRYNEALQAEQKRRQQQAQQPPIQIHVPAPATAQPRIQKPLVAAAPSDPGAFNEMVQPPVGRMVAPELPPLPGAEPYLPSSPVQLNGYIWPTKGTLTSGYGRRWGRMHKGIDIAAPVGTPVVAAAPGVVVYARWNSGGYGNLVDIQHPDGSVTRYGHNNRLLVREGQQVEQGQQISEMGSTGFSTGPHLHFEVHPSGKGAVNPIAFLPRR